MYSNDLLVLGCNLSMSYIYDVDVGKRSAPILTDKTSFNFESTSNNFVDV